jgi:hypothetical protein
MAAGRDASLTSLEDATVALLQQEPELRAQLRTLLSTAIARFQHTIEFGSPDARLTAMKAIVPGLIKSMGRVEQSAGEAEQRAAYERLLHGITDPEGH